MVNPTARAFCVPIRRPLLIKEAEIPMMRRISFASKYRFICVISVICGLFPAAANAATCDSLRTANPAITLAQSVPPGGFTPQGGRGAEAFKNLPAFCRIAATLKPTSDSDIKIEVWLPESGWNGKLQAVGNGAWAGTISYPALATALAAGYAAVSTDTGHVGGDPKFMVGHPEKLVDFEERSVHEMTVTAKAMTGAYYGNAP